VMNSQALPDRPVLTTASSWNWYDVEISLAVAYLALGWSRIIPSLIGLSTCLSTADGWGHARDCQFRGCLGMPMSAFFFSYHRREIVGNSNCPTSLSIR
jgi:hypothetical protein